MKRILLLVIIAFIGTFSVSCDNEDTPSHTTLWIPDAPYSSDPLDFDNLFHHIVFYSVFSPLVTEYKSGSVTGLIAESWSSTDDFKTWTFKIRPDLKFENGDPITSEAIQKSFKRIFFLLKQRKSQNGIVENILGIDKFDNLSDPLSGLVINNNPSTYEPNLTSNLTFTLTKPIKNFLALISFGMYSIVHPSLYDSQTGNWLNQKKSISSATYSLGSWDENHLELTLRNNYKSPIELTNTKKITTLKIYWPSKDSKNETSTQVAQSFPSSYDLTYGTSDEVLVDTKIDPKDSKEYFGGTVSEIRFVRCLSYYLPSSPCSDRDTRIAMRDVFYLNLIKLGFQPIKSFFPLVMSGIKEIQHSFTIQNKSKSMSSLSQKTININDTNASNPIVKNGYKSSLEAIAESFGMKLNFKNISSGKIYEDIELQPKTPEVDICSNVSGIYIDKPQDDVQFMFKSKEGVMLPDTDGRIMSELNQSPVDLQKVNELLWDQAVVWPLSHYGIGFWAIKNRYDFSAINLAKTPTMFELIRLK